MLHNIMISIGALNEAISDIFGALFNAFIGKNDEDICLVPGESQNTSTLQVWQEEMLCGTCVILY
jgi:hypothetical protein